jgi:hypothetical protein
MAVVYEATLVQDYLDQQVINTMAYIAQQDGISNTSAALANALGFTNPTGSIATNTANWTGIADALLAFQNDSLTYSQLTIIAHYDPLDFFDSPFPAGLTGGRVGPSEDASPPFVAASLRGSRVRRDVRRSFRRIAGMYTTGYEKGVLQAAELGALGNIATEMSAVISGENPSGQVVSFTPMTISLAPVPGQPGRYEYPATEQELIDRSAVGITFSAEDTVTTQNSRKRGRGQ